jgi:hypothetical protein
VQEEIEHESSSTEIALRTLWEKARLASALIATLQEQKSMLQQRIQELEQAMTQMRNEAVVKDMEIMQLRAEIDRMQAGMSKEPLLNVEDRVELQTKIQTLLQKIETHL